MYHLKSLLSEGFIKKTTGGYQLTALGKRYVDKLSLKNFQPRFQPKIVTVIICRNSKGEYLLCHSSRQPFFGKFCFPYGKVHFGETIKKAADRELEEKTGLTYRQMDQALEYLQRIHVTVLASVGNCDLDLQDVTRKTAAVLGLPPQAVGPLLARTFAANLRARNEGDPVFTP